jgi:hypothetical protein
LEGGGSSVVFFHYAGGKDGKFAEHKNSQPYREVLIHRHSNLRCTVPVRLADREASGASYRVTQLLIRFIIGGAVVSFFAAFGDAVKPKSFAGLFAAAPSVAMATLGLTIMKEGKLFVATESRSMIFGAIALFLYATAAIRLMMKHKVDSARAAILALTAWMICAIGSWYVLLR